MSITCVLLATLRMPANNIYFSLNVTCAKGIGNFKLKSEFCSRENNRHISFGSLTLITGFEDSTQKLQNYKSQASPWNIQDSSPRNPGRILDKLMAAFVHGCTGILTTMKNPGKI